MIARWAVAPQIDAGDIRPSLLRKNGLRRRWAAATLKNKSAPLYLHEFVKLLAENPVVGVEKESNKRMSKSGLQLLNACRPLKCEAPPLVRRLELRFHSIAANIFLDLEAIG